MSGFKAAKQFFEACEAGEGWDGCQEFVADDAVFAAQSEPIVDIKSVKDYAEWMKQMGGETLKGASYTLHSSAWDEDKRCALFFATFHATHVGEGGPVPPTNQSTNTDYVYAIKMDQNDAVTSMTKIWNAPWALNELGWT